MVSAGMMNVQAVQKERFYRSAKPERSIRIRPHFIDFHRLKMTDTYEYPQHQHSNYELILVKSGPYRCLLNATELELSAHQILLIKPGDWHQDHLRAGQYHYVLHFQLGETQAAAEAELQLFQPAVSATLQVCRGPFQQESLLLEELAHEARQATDYSAAIQDALLESIFWRVVRQLSPEALSSQFKRRSVDTAFVDRFERLLESHHRESLSVEQMAHAMDMSPRSLTQRCEDLLGDSPARLLVRYRIDKAIHLLNITDRTVKEVAYDLGFANPYHFSQVFKRVTGQAPQVYRKQAQAPTR